MWRRMRTRRYFAVLAMACTAARGSAAQTPGPQEQIPTIKREVRLVLVEATAKDKTGRVKKTLKQDDFIVYEDGQRQVIAHFSQDQLPLAVALVVDTSSSIQPLLRPLREVARTALQALKAEDQVALFTFYAHTQKRVDLTRDKQKVAEAIEAFGTVAGTNINDALYDAAQYLREKAPAARRVIVLVSDNMPSVSGAMPDQVLKELLRADAAVYSLQVPSRNPKGIGPAQWIKRGLVNVKLMAQETGGEILEIGHVGVLQEAVETLVDRLKSRYTLGFYPSYDPGDRKFKKIEVKLRPSLGVNGKDYTIVAKSGYYPAGKK